MWRGLPWAGTWRVGGMGLIREGFLDQVGFEEGVMADEEQRLGRMIQSYIWGFSGVLGDWA